MTSKQHQVAIAFIDGYNKWDIDVIMASRAPTCYHQVLPESLNQPLMDNDAYRIYFSSLMPHFRDFTVTIKTIVDDEKEGKTVIWCSSTAETVIGAYVNEYMVLLEFDDSREKLVAVREFVDSHNSYIFFPRLKEVIKKRVVEQ